ncbi:CARDB domain-containing protein [Methanoculleus sediminis]|uniref:CARDB domain-containing protein n=1 Tax=Methanoculleus sediminis TaxID=1550566 RepID=UPI0012E01D18|nr:CARDB domain-containing protein [Methanoculleus sediminis]
MQAGSALVVAAGDSSAQSKAQADYVCDGTADQIEIQNALNAGGTVTLTEGTFHLSGNLNIPSNVVLEGQGPDATWLKWSSGLMQCQGKENFVLRDFKTTGTGAIFIQNCDRVKVHNVTATVDNSRWGGAFTLWVSSDVMEDIEFVNCRAVDCGRHGWQSDGDGSVKTIRNIRYIDCEAINCGRDSRFAPHGQWTCGFQLAENANIEDCEVVRCYAEGNWEAGFIVEAAPSKKNIVLRDCVSKNNGVKPDNYYNGPDEDMYGALFGAGFWLHGDMTLINCTAEKNRKAGFAVWYPLSYTKLYGCSDTGSEIGYKFDYTDNVYVEDCTSRDAGRYGIYAANAGKITTNGLTLIAPKGDGSKSNVFGVSGYPVRESSFEIETYGGAGTVVSCPSGQNVQFSGTVRSDAAQPVAVSGSVDTSRLSVVPYSGGAPTPTPTPTLTPTPAGKPDLVVTDISWEPASPAPGSAVTMKATIRNQGDAPTPAGTKHGVLFTFDDGAAGPGVWSDAHTASLAPGAWVTVTANGGSAGALWTAVEGAHTVQAHVDDVNRIVESNEANNVRTGQIMVMKSAPTPTPTPTPTPVGRPDLVVTGVSWEPASPVAGDVVTLKATIKNQGTGPTPAGTKHGVLFMFDDGAAGPGVWSDTHTASLAPGASVTVTANGGSSGATWKAVEGTHTVKAHVDDVDRIPESNEANNVRSEEITVSKTAPAPAGKPDLVVTHISWKPTKPVPGSDVTFRATIKNQGTAPTPPGVISGVAFLVDDRLTVWSDGCTRSIPPGSWVTVTANGGPSGTAVWKGAAGTHTIQAWVDDIDRMAETNEENNRRTTTLTL